MATSLQPRRRIPLQPAAAVSAVPASSSSGPAAKLSTATTTTTTQRDEDPVGELIAKVLRSLDTGETLESLFSEGSGVRWDSIMAIRAQLVQTSVKKSSHIHKKKLAGYVERYR